MFYKQLPFSFIHSLTDPFCPDIHNIVKPKPSELESLKFEKMFISHHVSCVTCYLSPFTCHLSCVTCHLLHVKKIFYIFFIFKKNKRILFLFIFQRILTKWRSYSVEGLLSTGHTPSSFKCNKVLIVFFLSCIRETKHLSTDKNSTTDTKTFC